MPPKRPPILWTKLDSFVATVIGICVLLIATTMCSGNESSTSPPPAPTPQQDQLVPQQEYDTALCEGSDYLTTDDCKVYGDE